MNHLSFLLFSFSLAIVFSASQCNKNSDNEPQLPPQTTTGAMTLGCKVNGKTFVPRDGNGKPGMFCQYVNLGSGEGGGWFLNIPATNWKSSPIESIHIETDSLLVEEGATYDFKNQKGYPRAFYFKTTTYLKGDTASGRLHITKHDRNNRILSGTFEFAGTNNSGENVHITDGRFDIVY